MLRRKKQTAIKILILAVALIVTSLGTFVGQQTVFAVNEGANGGTVSCGKGAKQTSDGGSCKCKDHKQYLDESSDPESCVDKGKCPKNTTADDDKKVCVPDTSSSTDDCKFNGLCSDCANVGAEHCACPKSDQTGCADSAATSCGQSQCDLIANYLNPAIKLFSGLVGIIVVISIILGGIQYTTSEGDPQKAAKAKARITNSIIALIAFFFLYAFLEFLIPGGILHP